MDAIYRILEHANAVDPDRLSPRLSHLTRRFMIDTLAVMIAGVQAAGAREIRAYARQWTGGPAASLVTGERVAAPYAALANGMMAHAVEYDDTYEPADVHACCVVLPAVLAAAELDEARRTGRELVAATAIGVDIAYRMGTAIRTYRGWHPTATCGIFGATIAAGRIARLDPGALHHAAGLAYSLVSGTFQPVVDASLAKRLQPGFAARGAVEAILLARAGFTGPRDILEGTFGYYRLLEAGEYDRAILVEGLGQRYLGAEASMKPYPCCRFCHAAIDAALEIAGSIAGSAPDERRRSIAAVEVTIPEETLPYIGPRSTPPEDPRVGAQFSAAYTVASALLRRRVSLGEFSLEAVGDPLVTELASRVTVRTEPVDRYGPSSVRVILSSGEELARTVHVMKGQPERELDEQEFLAKVRDCLRHAGWDEHVAAELVSWGENLPEDADPVARLHAILQKGARR